VTSFDFTLTARSLSDWQTCRRRALLSADYSVLRPRPKAVFDRLLREGVAAIGRGEDASAVAATLRADFLDAARSPGLDLCSGSNVYAIAKDWTTMLTTVLLSVARGSVAVTHAVQPVRLAPSLVWQPSSPADDSGELHRWITAADFSPDDLARELHGWTVFGDLAVLRVPLTLHVVLTGSVRNGRRYSPWTRIFRHPGLPHMNPHFVAKSGAPLRQWKPEWLSDAAYPDYDAWVEQMHKEGVADSLIRVYRVNVPSDAVCATAVRQIIEESFALRVALENRGEDAASSAVRRPWSAWPMSRGACDGIVPCPWQECCHAEGAVEPAATGLYELRTQSAMSPTTLRVLSSDAATSSRTARGMMTQPSDAVPGSVTLSP